jgi:ethanolamine utilization protein EutN
MIIAKVVGTVISTRKNERLVGSKFLIIEPLKEVCTCDNSRIVAVDNVGAGVGEIVLVATGSAARVCSPMDSAPVDAAVVGIVDDIKDVIISRQ